MLWRGHAKQGRKKPGRRAVLEEIRCPSDLQHLTLSGAFPQVNFAVYWVTKLNVYSDLWETFSMELSRILERLFDESRR